MASGLIHAAELVAYKYRAVRGRKADPIVQGHYMVAKKVPRHPGSVDPSLSLARAR